MLPLPLPALSGGESAQEGSRFMEEEAGKHQDKNPIEPVRMTLDSKFRFSCNKGLECFRSCCGKITVFLTPYDVLRIKNRLGITSAEFLSLYTRIVDLKKTKLPFFLLNMTEDGRCPFVGEDGCNIYTDRPLVCRYYPIGLGFLKGDGIEGGDFYFTIREPFCKGFEEEREWSVQTWRESQEIDRYDLMNKDWFDIVLNKKLRAAGVEPDEKSQRLYMLGSFDMDSFRKFVFESRFLDLYDVDRATVEMIRDDEAELLRFAHKWLKGVLFGEYTYPRKEA